MKFMFRHGRARPGHPRLGREKKEDVDTRDKPGHDGVDKLKFNKAILFYDIASLTSSAAASASGETRSSSPWMIRR